jgi:hypothetical protein
MAKRTTTTKQRAGGFSRETAAGHGRTGGNSVHVTRKAMRAKPRPKPKTSHR